MGSRKTRLLTWDQDDCPKRKPSNSLPFWPGFNPGVGKRCPQEADGICTAASPCLADLSGTLCRKCCNIPAGQWLTTRDVRLHRCLVQLKPPFRVSMFSFTGHCVGNPATNITKKTRGHSAEMRKAHENTTVLNKHKRTFTCWLICQVATFEALRLLEKKKTWTIQRHRGAASLFLRLVVQKRYPSTLGNCLCFLKSHRTDMSR